MNASPARSDSPAEAVAGLLAASSIFASAIAVVWHPLRLVIASAILAVGDGSYGVLYAVAGVGAMLGAAAIVPVKGVR